LSPDELRIVTASNNKTAPHLGCATAKEIAVLNGHKCAVWSAADHPSDGALAVGFLPGSYGISQWRP
jgi:hypothetical protein